MSPQDPPKIEFPCPYPIKVVGRAGEALEVAIIEIFTRHADDFDQSLMQVRASRAGTFVSITIVIEATGSDQLSALHEDLMATGLVSMVI
ncbi:conserved hypothetical protein [Luminiphilus syltensis NOR5-1B]|uniref:UPF0250 protein NOR51B_2089 n=1 Tax=Luminiphilus syltensis NOR5-1B TaxID=565045 RepID=B8KSL6_9GAMM|nr:DUF493 domain-containing protein [Luminiphilus syltensis]EED36141.1 conserved hypothetical protein [Luminiphilus syltensis NOR5-1B]